ncbi:MAG: alpha/beta hydrolase [Candidatus Obscuribacterales bacterium]|nr:alpha/beta hydrolase [Candidatus Obscuribacterales bacterium]
MIKPKKLIIFNFLVLFATFAGAYLALASILNNHSILQPILLHPEIGTTENYERAVVTGIKRTDIDIPTVDGNKMHAWLFTLPNANKIAIVSHGNAANIAYRLHIAKALLKAGCSVLLYDYRGYGKSTGNATMNGILEDGITVYDYVHNTLKYDDKHIILYGESIGSGVTCHIASLRPCLGVIIQSGLASIPSTAKAQIPFLAIFPDFVFAQPHFANAEALSKIHVPILLIHGKLDHTVASSESAKMFARANEPQTLIWLDHCGHNDVGDQDSQLFHESIENFVRTLP